MGDLILGWLSGSVNVIGRFEVSRLEPPRRLQAALSPSRPDIVCSVLSGRQAQKMTVEKFTLMSKVREQQLLSVVLWHYDIS